MASDSSHRPMSIRQRQRLQCVGILHLHHHDLIKLFPAFLVAEKVLAPLRTVPTHPPSPSCSCTLMMLRPGLTTSSWPLTRWFPELPTLLFSEESSEEVTLARSCINSFVVC